TFPVGVTTNTFEVTDAAGNRTSCSFTVTVVDNQAPTITCPANISVNNTPGTCGAAVTYTTPVGTDNCSGAITTQTAGLASGATFPVGVTTNTFKVTDAAGNSTSCSFTVTVIDNQPPTIINCPADYAKNTDSGTCTATFDPADPTANDNCFSLLSFTWAMTGATVVNSPTTGINTIGSTTFNSGTTTITYTATDPGGNSVTCVYKVVVTDNEVPSITCPVGVNVGVDSGTCSRTFIPSSPVYSDNCSVASLTWTMTGATSGSSATTGINLIPSTSFNKGTTTVTYTVKDGAGLTNTCQFLVTVTDNILPTLTCPATPQTRNIDSSFCTYKTVGTEFDPVGGDNCPGYTIQNNLNFGATLNGYAFPLGTTTVQWIIQDAAGNASNCSFTVTVNDNQPPVFTSCPPTPAPLCADSTGKYTKTGTSWDATAT
ncbi:HYR domain-containing protein, partial [bacterium]|nr:HYR domain-containing protein [bacterium]